MRLRLGEKIGILSFCLRAVEEAVGEDCGRDPADLLCCGTRARSLVLPQNRV